MNRPDDDPPSTEIGDFAEVLVPEQGEEPPVVVGGHAVNFWALYSLHRGASELEPFLPFTSKDLDLVGTMHLLESLHRPSRARNPSPNPAAL